MRKNVIFDNKNVHFCTHFSAINDPPEECEAVVNNLLDFRIRLTEETPSFFSFFNVENTTLEAAEAEVEETFSDKMSFLKTRVLKQIKTPKTTCLAETWVM